MQGKELLHCGKVEEQGLFLAKRSVTNQVIKCSITNSQLNRVFFFWGGVVSKLGDHSFHLPRVLSLRLTFSVNVGP